MPSRNSCPIEQALEKTKSRRSNKGDKCCPPTPCDIPCCVPEFELDCCSIPYQRLEKLRTAWSLIAATGGDNSSIFPDVSISDNVRGVVQRNGNPVAVPDVNVYGVDGVFFAENNSGVLSVVNGEENAFYGYLFVQSHRYLNFEACGKKDQVVGWYINVSTGNLELFQSLPDLNLTPAVTRSSLDAITIVNLTSIQKQQLYALNVLYKASIKAIAAVQANPKTEGNIVQVTDKCGQKWLIAINRAGGSDVCESATEFVIVAIPLC